MAFSPRNPSLLSAVSSDSRLRLFDLRTPVSAKYHLVADIPVHQTPPARNRLATGPGPDSHHAAALPPPQPAEILTHDWNKYAGGAGDGGVIATGGVDRLIRTFDLRMPYNGPLTLMAGHEYAVRRLAWSPHAADVLVSASYDMTVRVWTDGSPAAMGGPPPVDEASAPVRPGRQLGLMNRHTEFATGVDWCLFGAGGWVASVGWDERVLLWDANSLLRR